MLTQYDEYPVHQSPYPFSQIPSTDISWDDGYFQAVWSVEHRIYLTMSMRINANTDIIGGSVILSFNEKQYAIRLSRVWRPDCDTRIGPLRFRFVEPFKHLLLTLDANDSPLSFELNWRGVAPPFLEDHHLQVWRGRRITDQSRYVQVGAPDGWIQIGERTFEVTPDKWGGSRDHSWGLYESRRPLADLREFLPPGKPPSERALRFWTMFKFDTYSGFFSIREDKYGVCRDFPNEMDGKSFEGLLNYGWEGKEIQLSSARHEIVFKEGTRIPIRGKVSLKDVDGNSWFQEFEICTTPFVMAASGRSIGGWSDG